MPCCSAEAPWVLHCENRTARTARANLFPANRFCFLPAKAVKNTFVFYGTLSDWKASMPANKSSAKLLIGYIQRCSMLVVVENARPWWG